jgi:N-acetyl-gamma-glutamylphosphate reductase
MPCVLLQTSKLIATGGLMYKAHLIAAVPLTDSSLAAPAVTVRSVTAISGISGTAAAAARLSLSAVIRDPHADDAVTDARRAAHAAALITDQGSQESTS